MFLVILNIADTMHSAADMTCSAANTMHGQNQCHTPPHMAKNKFLLNEYLGIYMHFESIFFIFLNLENGLIQTRPPTKSGKFQIFFLNPSLRWCFYRWHHLQNSIHSFKLVVQFIYSRVYNWFNELIRCLLLTTNLMETDDLLH